MSRRDHFRRLQQAHYKSHTFSNPYFKPTKHSLWLPLGLTAAVLAVIFISMTILFYSGAFYLLNVTITGMETVPLPEINNYVQNQINQKRFLIFPQRNFFLLKTKQLQEELIKKFNFETVEIRRAGKNFFITVKERTSMLLWFTGDTLHLVDLDGIVIRTLSDTEKTMALNRVLPLELTPLARLPIFRGLNPMPTDIGTKVLSREEVEAIFRFHQHLQEQGIAFTETQVDRLAGKLMSILTKSGYLILFDASGDIDGQAARLGALLKETIPDTSKLEYIDLRFGDHVYYK